MKTLVCFGDSNTFGYDPRSYIGGRYPPEERWVDLLADALGLKCLNRGMNGRCIPRRGEGLRLAEGEGLIVMLGGNDLLCGSTAGECAELLRAFLLNCTLGGGALIIALTLIAGTTDYNGAGTDVIAAAIEQGRARPWDAALKLLFTAVTLSCGFRGGEMVPTFFIGATMGCALGPVLGIPAGFAGAVGLAAVFCGAVNCPVASVILAMELFGADGAVYFAVATAIAYMLSGYSGLYRSQKIIYSKLKAEYIDIHAK